MFKRIKLQVDLLHKVKLFAANKEIMGENVWSYDSLNKGSFYLGLGWIFREALCIIYRNGHKVPHAP